MIRAAREENNKAKKHIDFVQGNAEDLKGIIADNSVDMLVSGSSNVQKFSLSSVQCLRLRLFSFCLYFIFQSGLTKQISTMKHKHLTGSTGKKSGPRLNESYDQAEQQHSG